MTRLFRILAGLNSTTVTATATIPPPPGDGIGTANVDTDFVVILASLLCALICVLGLFAVVRCAWIRRICGEGSDDFPSAAPSSAANKGLKKKVMKALPKLPYSAELSEKFSECPICLTEFDAGDEIRVLPPCGHGFHVTCIDTWLGSRSSCPSCRKILVPEPRCKKCGEFRFAGGTTPTGLTSGTFDRFLP